jgi:hypothetical protein
MSFKLNLVGKTRYKSKPICQASESGIRVPHSEVDPDLGCKSNADHDSHIKLHQVYGCSHSWSQNHEKGLKHQRSVNRSLKFSRIKYVYFVYIRWKMDLKSM